MEQGPNIFKKPSNKPTEEGYLNEVKRELNLIEDKFQKTEENKNPPTIEEIEEVVNRINKGEDLQNPK